VVRYGVPDPVAAWLMGFGLLDRSTAMAVAVHYHRQGGQNDPAHARDWFGQQDPVLLANIVGARAEATLRELSKAIRRINRPRLARDLGQGELLPRDAIVRIDDEPAAVLAVSRLSEGDRLELRRDYDDLIDRNQITVFHDGEQIGRLDGFSGALLAVELDAGHQVGAMVTDLTADAGADTISVRLIAEPA